MSGLKTIDPEIYGILKSEERRQARSVRLIASENYVSAAVREASGSVFANKYSEGYAGARYYEGNQDVDRAETLAIERAKALFHAEHANVQPYSGSPANLAAYLAFMKPGDTVLGMNLSHGGHLTHGSKASITGKYFVPVFYNLNRETGRIDYDEVRSLALQHRPKLIIAGHSAYPRFIDFAAFRAIADEVGAIFLVDMAHFAGLVAGGVHPDPVPFADIVTTTTHKTLRGPRGAMILCKAEHAAKIDKAVFPGLQGGPHDATTAAIAVALHEAATKEFKAYAKRVVKNAAALARELTKLGYDLISGGTDNHLVLVDLRNKDIGGKAVAVALDAAGLVCNCNAVAWDTRPPKDPSGIRLGSPPMTTRGFGEKEFVRVARWIDKIVSGGLSEKAIREVRSEVLETVKGFPVP